MPKSQTLVKQFLALATLAALSSATAGNLQSDICFEIVNYSNTAEDFFAMATQHYSVADYLITDQKLSPIEYHNQVASLDKLVEAYLHTPTEESVDHISNWVSSDAHAVFFYEFMIRLRRDHREATEIFGRIAKINPYLFDKKTSGNGAVAPVSFTYEKEGQASFIADCYKVAGYSKERWFSIPRAERYEILQHNATKTCERYAFEDISPTAICPSYYGQFQREAGADNFVWEFTHPKYELSLERLRKEMLEIAERFNQSRGFHVHAVFEIEKEYHFREQLGVWLKYLSDYLILAGIRDGMQPATSTTAQANWKDFLTYKDDGTIVLRRVKLANLGIREGKYGDTLEPDRYKMGLELRDSFKTIEKYFIALARISDSIENRAWEKISPRDFQKLTPQLYSTVWVEQDLVQQLVQISTRFVDWPTKFSQLYLPLKKYEEGQYFDFKKGEFVAPTAEQKARIIAARRAYVASVIDLAHQVIKEKDVEQEDIDLLLKLEVNTWSKAARVDELYESF